MEKHYSPVIFRLTLYALLNLLVIQVYGQVTVVPASGGDNLCLSGNYKALSLIEIKEASPNDFSSGINLKYTLAAPSGYEFLPNAGVIHSSLSNANIEVTTQQIILTYTATAASLTQLDHINISGIHVKSSFSGYHKPGIIKRTYSSSGTEAVQNNNNINDEKSHGVLITSKWLSGTVEITANSSCNEIGNGAAIAEIYDMEEQQPYEGSFTYSWYKGHYAFKETPDFSGKNITDLEEGDYTLIIQDNSSGCFLEPLTFEINKNSSYFSVSHEVLAENSNCSEPNGSVKAFVYDNESNEVTEGYTFNWYRGASLIKETPDFTGPQQNNLPAGNYTVLAIDQKTSCASGFSNIVLDNDFHEYPYIYGYFETDYNASCNDLSITANAYAGPGEPEEYQFFWYEGYQRINDLPDLIGNEVDLLPNRFYTLVVKDQQGCSPLPYSTYVGENNDRYALINSVDDYSCNDQPGGEATATFINGEIDDEILWYKGVNVTSGDLLGTGASIQNLTPGFYTVIAKTPDGCLSYPNTVYIDKTNFYYPLQVEHSPATTCEAQDGHASARVFDFQKEDYTIEGYTFNWYKGSKAQYDEPYFTGPSPINLPVGIYTIRAIHNNSGCLTNPYYFEIYPEESSIPYPYALPTQHNVIDNPNQGSAKGLDSYYLETQTYTFHWYKNKENHFFSYDLRYNEWLTWGEPDHIGPEIADLNTGYHSLVAINQESCFSMPVYFYIAELDQQVSSKNEKDALLNLYASAYGQYWQPKVNWLEEADIAKWDGITTNEQNKVTEINLAQRNLTGTIPSILTSLTELHVLNLEGNDITSLENLTTLSWTNLDLRNNKLQFASLELNQSIQNFHFASQKPVGQKYSIEVYAGDDFELSILVSGSKNKYQWFKGANAVSSIQTTPEFPISNIGKSDEGSYHCKISHDDFAGFSLVSEPVQIIPVADISGKVFTGSIAFQNGEVILLKVPLAPTASFDTVGITLTDDKGLYDFNKIRLDQYWLIVRGNNAIPTYYGDGISWTDAQIINLTQNLDNININIYSIPEREKGEGKITGYVELGITLDGKVATRKRVAKAGVAIYRAKSASKGQLSATHELIAYTETNDQGEFTISDLEDGKYRLIIELPGIPMNESAFFDIEISGAKQKEVKIAATVEKDGIFLKIEDDDNSTTGTQLNFQSGIKVYPNPTHQWVNIIIPQNTTTHQIQLSETSGRDVTALIKQKISHPQNIALDVSQLKPGYYLLKVIHSNGMSEVIRVVVK
jgi:hypothetical protein